MSSKCPKCGRNWRVTLIGDSVSVRCDGCGVWHENSGQYVEDRIAELEAKVKAGGHQMLTPKECRERNPNSRAHDQCICPVCDGGLGVCKVCGAAEAELDAGSCADHLAAQLRQAEAERNELRATLRRCEDENAQLEGEVERLREEVGTHTKGCNCVKCPGCSLVFGPWYGFKGGEAAETAKENK